jgi:hypothetical protein
MFQRGPGQGTQHQHSFLDSRICSGGRQGRRGPAFGCQPRPGARPSGSHRVLPRRGRFLLRPRHPAPERARGAGFDDPGAGRGTDRGGVAIERHHPACGRAGWRQARHPLAGDHRADGGGVSDRAHRVRGFVLEALAPSGARRRGDWRVPSAGGGGDGAPVGAEAFDGGFDLLCRGHPGRRGRGVHRSDLGRRLPDRVVPGRVGASCGDRVAAGVGDARLGPPPCSRGALASVVAGEGAFGAVGRGMGALRQQRPALHREHGDGAGLGAVERDPRLGQERHLRCDGVDAAGALEHGAASRREPHQRTGWYRRRARGWR